MDDPDIPFLHAAADPTRLAILRELSSEGSVRACDLTACCTVHQPTVSHHLRVLREAGWVCSERHGANISYKLCPAAAARFMQIAGEIRPGVERPMGALSIGVVRSLAAVEKNGRRTRPGIPMDSGLPVPPYQVKADPRARG